jgi:predicted enzyme related to lactoylglutathione lyase
MTIKKHSFCWTGITSKNMATALPFYESVLGWTFGGPDDMPMFAAGGTERGHANAPMAPEEPSAWTSYLLVDDVDAAITAATTHGGVVLVPATTVPSGRFTILATPSGAVFGLWQSDNVGTKPTGSGSVHWVELNSTNMDADIAWLTASFGYTTRESDSPRGRYVELLMNDEAIGGVVGAQPDAPAHWLTWVQVDHLDNTLSRVGTGGGKALSPVMNNPSIGRMAVVSDPTGAVFGIIQPATA